MRRLKRKSVRSKKGNLFRKDMRRTRMKSVKRMER